MFRRVMEHDAMSRIAQKGLTCLHGLENAALASDAEVALISDLARHEPDDGL
jgi:hypothetical protein